MDAKDTVKKFVQAFQDLDPDALEELMVDDAVNYITNATGGADRVEGARAYGDRFRAMHKDGLEMHIYIRQLLDVKPGQVLMMIEGKMSRGDKKLHNFGGFLINVNPEGKITETWMVDAKPAESDEFWKS